MRVASSIMIALITLVFGVLPAQAQYAEIYRVDKAANGIPEQQAFDNLAAHLGVSADTLKQEKTTHNLSFGQLYMAHQLAKTANADLNTIVSELKPGKPWSTRAREKNVKIDKIAKDEREVEKLLKKKNSTQLQAKTR